MKSPSRPLAGFHWHNATQFLGALNDNLFKLLIVYGLVKIWPETGLDSILGIVGLVFATPFLLFLGFGGMLADRFPKYRVIQMTKLAEVMIMTFGVVGFLVESAPMLLATVFLMSTQSACFGPSKFGVIPELVEQTQLSRANSYLQAAAYFAIILGTALAPEISYLSGREGSLATVACIVVAILGFLTARRIPRTPDGDPNRRASLVVLQDVWRGMKEVRKDGFLNLAVWSSAVFSFVGAYVQMNLLAFGETTLGLSPEGSTRLFFATAIGIGIGAILAGRLSRGGIEVGIIPIGTGLMLASCLGFFALGTVGDPSLAYAVVLSLILGAGAGIFVVPVEAFIQFRTPGDRLGSVLATSAWLSWAGVLLSAIALLINTSLFGITAAEGFIFLAVVLGLMTVVALVALPDFLTRFLAFLVTRLMYRVRATGLENLPSHGPALLVCNHVSVMDGVWLLSTQLRRIRFIASREAIARNHPLVRFFLRLGRVIPIEDTDGPKTLAKSILTARKALQDGFIVGIFPEGSLSRTGHLLPFKRGFERIVRGLDCPVIGGWIEGGYGSHASLAHGHVPQPLDLRDFRRRIHIHYGRPVDLSEGIDAVRDAVEAAGSVAIYERCRAEGGAGERWIASARRHWGRLAMTDHAGKELTFGKALVGSILIQKKLRRELSPGEERTGILLPPSIGGALTNLALALEGRVAVNLNYTGSREVQGAALELGEIRTVITSKLVLEKLPDVVLPEKVILLEDLMGTIRASEKLGGLLAARFAPKSLLLRKGRGASISDPMAVLFSSGSTAVPKGIELSAANIFGNIEAFAGVGRLRRDDRMLGILPFFHSMGLTITLWFPMTKGLSVAFHSNPLDAKAVEAIALRFQPTVVLATPSLLLSWTRKIDRAAFASTRWMIAGAEKLKPRLAEMLEARYGVMPREGYGCTECSPVVAVNVEDMDRDGLRQTGTKMGTVGRPLPGVRVRIVDPETGAKLPVGSEGLIEVAGVNVMKRYLGDPGLTEEALRDGWYRTGDLGQLDEEGFLKITDRLSRFSKIGGEMVSHTMVEEALVEALGLEINQLAVTTLPDERKGERLVVIHAAEAKLCARRITEGLRKVRLPNLWKPSPTNWMGVAKLPLLGSGKLDLKGLKKLAEEQEVGRAAVP